MPVERRERGPMRGPAQSGLPVLRRAHEVRRTGWECAGRGKPMTPELGILVAQVCGALVVLMLWSAGMFVWVAKGGMRKLAVALRGGPHASEFA